MKLTTIAGASHVALVALLVAGCGEGDRFEKARQENTVAAYEKYLTEHPQGKFAKDAKAAIEALNNRAGFNRKASDLAKRCQEYFAQFRDAVDKAPSGITLMTIAFESEDLSGPSTSASPELTRTISALSARLGPLVEANKKYMEELKPLVADSKDFSARFEKVQAGAGQQYLDYWNSIRDQTLAAVDAFIAEAQKLSP